MSDVGHVVVIGGGVAGCATAYELSAAGTRVTVIEREGVGTQASGWSAGGLNPLHGIPEPLAAFAMESFRLHLALWPEIERLTGEQLGARRISMAMIAPDDSEVVPLLELRDAFEMARGDGFAAQWLEPVELEEQEPRLSPDVEGALLTFGNAILDSRRLTELLAKAAERRGATVKTGTVTGIERAGGRVSGVVVDGTVFACDAVVIAAGPWTGAASAWLDVPLPVEPLKGEILRMQLPGRPLSFDVVAPGISLFARPDGQVWLASTQERAGFDTSPTEAGYQRLYGNAVALMPAVKDATLIQQTVCLRPLSPDDLPILGPVPGVEGAYVATGGGTKGILLAPAMGRAVSDLIVKGSTTVPIAACDPVRFTKG